MRTLSERTYPVNMPSEPGLHWRYLQILLAFRPGELDVDALRAELPRTRREGAWTATDGHSDAPGHVDARLIRTDTLNHDSSATKPESPESPAPPEWIFELSAYRHAAAHGVDPGQVVSHEKLLSALDSAFHSDELIAICSAALLFSADVATWRPSLLAEPQELTEIGAELGAISLAGLTLRFEGTLPGLMEARLEVSPDDSEYLTDLRFSYLLPRSAIADLYRTILSKAERYATLFIKSEE